ncbi:bacterial Ig-like domain-containing protein, partial [Enterococcus faecalis]|uniref:bacterial Ig-like domain-containing protein n=1 Tax=Enterococcus faecalis TaxID=1351 RepID=UPI0017825199
STLLLSFAPILSMPTASADGVVAINEWEITVNGDTTVLTNYIGQAKDVVIPLSGDLGTTNVKITKTALRAAATSADNQGGTLANSANDTAGTGLVADNSTDDNPSDTTVDYSGTFKDLTKITKIDLSQLKIEAHDGANGQDVNGVNATTYGSKGEDARGEDGQAGESIDVSSMFENCTALKEVDLSSFVGRGGNGGDGGNGYGGNGNGGAGHGGNGYGGAGGYAGNFNVRNMFEKTLQLVEIQLATFVGRNGKGGKGGNGYGGDGGNGTDGYGWADSGGQGGDGAGGYGWHGGTGNGGHGGNGGDGEGIVGATHSEKGSHGGQGGAGAGGNGGAGGDGHGGNGYGGAGGAGHGGNGGKGGDGKGGTGGNGGDSAFMTYAGRGGAGGDGTGGNGGKGGNGTGGSGWHGGAGSGGDGGGGGVGHGGAGGNGGNGVTGDGWAGSGGNGGDGGGKNGDGDCIGGDGGAGHQNSEHGVDGSGRNGDTGIPGSVVVGCADDSLKPENLTGEDLRLYQAYTGITDDLNMFYPIAVNELALTKKVGFAPDELKENVGALRMRNSLYKGENIRDLRLENVYLSAKDTAGNAIDLADVSKKAGEYTLTYTYNGTSIDTHLTVEGGSITIQDLTLGTGDAWKPEDNFVSAKNEQQQPIPFDQLTVTGADQVNLSKAGTYTVSFSYQDVSKTLTADAKVNVIDIQTKSLVLDVGDPWQPYAALTSVTNVDQVEHTAQVYFEQNVTASAIDKGLGTTVDIAQLTTNPGTYTVTYTYAGISRSVDVLVEKIELAN